jgi:Outer membrane protein beta-barrel domain
MLLILLAVFAEQSRSQIRVDDDKKPPATPPISIDGSFLLGMTSGAAQTKFSSIYNYTNAINPIISSPVVTSGMAIGVQAGVGHYLNLTKNWGYGVGLLYFFTAQTYKASTFQVQYQSTDFQNNTFRQSVNAVGPVSESITSNSLSLPLLIKYKANFSRDALFELEFGPVINLLLLNFYSTNAIFNYGAIYSYKSNGSTVVAVFDSAAVPAATDLFYTADSVQRYFAGSPEKTLDSLHKAGYAVGANVRPSKNSGVYLFNNIGFGIYIHPQITFKKEQRLNYKIGAYFSYLTYNNTVSSGYMLTNNVGDYNSMLKNISNQRLVSVGLTVGFSWNYLVKINPGGINM